MSSIDTILKERKLAMLASPSLKNRYETMLLNAFPVKSISNDYFHPNTFSGSDEVDYLRSVNLFKNKSWIEVSFDYLYTEYVQFLMLNEEGKIYYLPAFLNNFFDLRFTNLEFFTYFLSDLEFGFFVPTSDQLQSKSRDNSYQIPHDYSHFERINPIQSKLVAVFLVNVANLLSGESYEAQQAQRALTNYWGNFLLF